MTDADRLLNVVVLFFLVVFIAYMVGMTILSRRQEEHWKRSYRAMMEKGPSQRRRDQAYQMFSSDLAMEDARLAELRPRLDALVDSIYQHRVKLCDRTGLDFEDADIEGIISGYEELNRLCAGGTYDRGWFDAAGGWAHASVMKFKTPKARKAGRKT